MGITAFLKKLAGVAAFVAACGLCVLVADEARISLDPVMRSTKHIAYGMYPVALFSPDDSIKDVQIELIENEQKSLDIAIFAFTDQDTAHAVIDAHKRGVAVRVVADRSSCVGEYSKIFALRRAGIPVFVCPKIPDKSEDDIKGEDKALATPLMHNKFILFGKNIQDKQLLWTGSFNFTRSANARNQENVIILSDAQVLRRYHDQFQKLIERSELL